MKAIIKIYQLKDPETCPYAYCSYNKDKFNFKDYKEVAHFGYDEGKSVQDILSTIHNIGGNDRTLSQLVPGLRQLDTSDIIEVNEVKYYINRGGYWNLGR